MVSVTSMLGLKRDRAVVPVVRLQGMLASSSGPFQSSLNISGIEGPLKRAFATKHAKAVALIVNSPGGSPVQSLLIANRIRALSEEKKLPVLAFVEDVAGSGGYWVALAADEIIATPASIVGSIGVVSMGFGLHRFLERHGIERRLYTAGKSKAMLDPFSPEKEEDVARLRDIQDEMHTLYKDYVRERRGDRLKGDEDELFSGAFWLGKKALDMGLIDSLGDVRSVLRSRYGEKVRMPVIGKPKGFLARTFRSEGSMTERAASTLVDTVIHRLEARAHWQRFGL